MVVNYRQQSLIRPLPQKSKCLTEEEESGVGASHAKDQKAEAEGMAHGRNSQNFQNSCQQLEQKLPKLLKILSSTGLSDKTKPAPPTTSGRVRLARLDGGAPVARSHPLSTSQYRCIQSTHIS
jgi:hypothetical protein